MLIFSEPRRGFLLAAIGTWIAVAAVARAESPPTYRATELGNLGGNGEVFTTALGLNNQGDVVGYSATPGTAHAFLWSNGEMTDIGAAGDLANTTIARDVNRLDWVIGELIPPDYKHRAFVWQNGAIRRLPPLEGDNRAFALQINNANVIVGWSWDGALQGARICERPTVWIPIPNEPGRYRATGIDLPGEHRCGNALDINDNGTVIGTYPAGDSTRSFIARSGKAERLPLSGVAALNADDQVLGWIINNITEVVNTVIWADGVTRNIGITGVAFNNKGHVVGYFKQSSTPALWMNGAAFDLRSRIVSVDPQTSCVGQMLFELPRAINGRGQVVGAGSCMDADGHSRMIAILLTPVQ
jgi:probable HAF family extracellular repeat protein